MAKRYVCVLAVCILSWAREPTVAQQPATHEQWVNPGVSVMPTTDVAKFVKDLDGAFVGVLERTSAVFLDKGRPATLHTVLTFRVNEWLFPAVPLRTEGEVEVLQHGGTYIEDKGNLTPKRPAEFMEHLTVGTEYFVPVQNGDRFGKEREGRLMVGSALAMSRLDRGSVSSIVQGTSWPAEVIARARTASGTPGPVPSPREVLLEAVRKAGREKK